MGEQKKSYGPAFEELRRAMTAAESLRSLIESQQRQANQFRDALTQAHSLRFVGLQRQVEQLAEAQKRATQCVKTLSQLTAPYMPLKDQIEAFSAEIARTIRPFQAALHSHTEWERSLIERMKILNTSWVLPDRFEESVTGFARLSRLSDAARTKRPYAPVVAELFASEYGNGIEAVDEEATEDRDEIAINAGLNAELIAFPRDAYGQVVLAAGFEFRFESTPVPKAIERTDPNAAHDPVHWQVLSEIERRLRYVVEEILTELSGPNWTKSRVSEAVRRRWEQRQEDDRRTGRSVYQIIHYSDFMDLAQVIERSDNWTEAFEPIFENKDDFLVSLRRLHPLRKAIAHNRPLSKVDILTLVSEATRIFSALGVRPLG